MGKIFYIIGKSSTGKDSIYKELRNDSKLNLQPMVMYSTRPIRNGEKNGVDYHFVDEEGYLKLKEQGKIIEERVYHTMHGDWRYFTVDDEQTDLDKNSYIVIGVLDSYASLRDYYGKDIVVPIYIDVEDGVRLSRALAREMKQENRKYEELCRRFLADSKDFSEERICEEGITSANRFENNDFNECVEKIKNYIVANQD